MAENIIKDFVKKQTSTVTIGVPRQKPAGNVPEVRIEPAPAPVVTAAPAEQPVVEDPVETKPKGHVGRPKSEIEKVKLSVYVPAEAKAKLIRIQHESYKQNLNDVLLEAIYDYIKKNNL